MPERSEAFFFPLFPVGPNGNPRISRIFASSRIFDDEACDTILEHIDHKGWSEGSLQAGVENDQVRRVRQQACPVFRGGHFPLTPIAAAVAEANSQMWQFDVVGMDLVRDGPQVLKYTAERGDFYGWHKDIGVEHSQRKLSFTVQLTNGSDYEGGDLEFADEEFNAQRSNFRERGLIIIFPSYQLHRVTPVTRGERYSVTGWVRGPAFR